LSPFESYREFATARPERQAFWVEAVSDYNKQRSPDMGAI